MNKNSYDYKKLRSPKNARFQKEIESFFKEDSTPNNQKNEKTEVLPNKKDQNFLPKFTLLVPSEHDIELKVIPYKEYFQKRESDQSELSSFSLDEKSHIARELKENIQRDFIRKINKRAQSLPEDMLVDIGKRYLKIRKLKGKILLDNGLIHIISEDQKDTVILFNHALDIICSAPNEKNTNQMETEFKNIKKAKDIKVVGKTSKIEAKTKKGF